MANMFVLTKLSQQLLLPCETPVTPLILPVVWEMCSKTKLSLWPACERPYSCSHPGFPDVCNPITDKGHKMVLSTQLPILGKSSITFFPKHKATSSKSRLQNGIANVFEQIRAERQDISNYYTLPKSRVDSGRISYRYYYINYLNLAFVACVSVLVILAHTTIAQKHAQKVLVNSIANLARSLTVISVHDSVTEML